MTTLYGIKNCDTVRKARKWLTAHGVAYRFHDLRADGLAPARLEAWLGAAGWEVLLNRRGLAWRQLPAARKEDLDEAKAAALMLEEPTLIKRPVLEHQGEIRVGFTDAEYRETFR